MCYVLLFLLLLLGGGGLFLLIAWGAALPGCMAELGFSAKELL